MLTKRSQLYIFSKWYQKFEIEKKNWELSIRQKIFCKIDQIQVVSEMRIFYYCMPCLRATSKQKDDRTTVYCRTIVFLFRRVRTREAAPFFVSGVKNE